MAKKKQPADDINEFLANLEDVPAEQPAVPAAMAVPQVVTTTPAVAEEAAPDPNLELLKMLQDIKADFDNVNGEVMDCWRRDRALAQEVVDHFMGQLRENTATAVGVEMLVKTLDILSSSTLAPIKLLEVKTKLLAALRTSSVTINNSNVVDQGKELMGVLSTAERSDFDS